MMKQFVACLLVMSAAALVVTGCQPKDEAKAETAVEKAVDHTPSAPMDHPAH